MTHQRPPEDLIFRPAEERDRDPLSEFRCSRGTIHETEVQQFIRGAALDHALIEGTSYRLLVVLEDERLIGVAAHHPELLLVATSREGEFTGTTATRLQVMALSLDRQGHHLRDGRRLSDLVMQMLIHEAIASRDSAVLSAIVAQANVRSIALCERNGLTSQIQYDARHIRLTGRFSLS